MTAEVVEHVYGKPSFCPACRVLLLEKSVDERISFDDLHDAFHEHLTACGIDLRKCQLC